MPRPLTLLTALALALSACPSTDTCPEGDPAIDSFTLDSSTVTAGDELSGMVMVSNFELGGHDDMAMDDDDSGMAMDDDDADSACPGGHAHIFLDTLEVNPLGMPEEPDFTITIPADAAPGEHTLIARLHNRDHTILEPQVTAEATITVEAP